MIFQILNEIGETVMYTENTKYIPNKQQIDIMAKAGYKFKMDNKIISKKKLEEFINDKE